MPACTYFGDHEFTGPCGDAELDDLIAILRVESAGDWRVRKTTHTTGKLWWKKSFVRFELYSGLGHGEFQVINFHRDGTNWSINHLVPRELVIAYIYGTLNGLSMGKRGDK